MHNIWNINRRPVQWNPESWNMTTLQPQGFEKENQPTPTFWSLLAILYYTIPPYVLPCYKHTIPQCTLLSCKDPFCLCGLWAPTPRVCIQYPEGPSTQHLRTLVPNTIKATVFGTRVLNYVGYLDPRGIARHPKYHKTEIM